MAGGIKTEILADSQAGIVPRSVKTFSELHDYVDANCNGGREALFDELDCAAPDTDLAHTAATNATCELTNPPTENIRELRKSGDAANGLGGRSR